MNRVDGYPFHYNAFMWTVSAKAGQKRTEPNMNYPGTAKSEEVASPTGYRFVTFLFIVRNIVTSPLKSQVSSSSTPNSPFLG